MKRKCTTSILEPVKYCNVLNCSKTKLFKSIWLKLRSNYFRLYANLHVQFVYSIRQTALYPKMYTSVPTVGNWKCAKLKVKLTKETINLQNVHHAKELSQTFKCFCCYCPSVIHAGYTTRIQHIHTHLLQKHVTCNQRHLH